MSSTTRLPGEVVSGVHLNYVLGTEFVFSDFLDPDVDFFQGALAKGESRGIPDVPRGTKAPGRRLMLERST
jgi:hypothetical protein